MTTTHPTVVIGGGIVGICCALYLQKEGIDVTLVEPAMSGDSTAKWSCGQIAVSEIIPQSKPGIIKKVPGWLLDQKGPLALRPSALPGLLPWMLRFMTHARRSRIDTIAHELASLTRCAFQDYEPLLAKCRRDDLIGHHPTLELFDDAAGLAHEQTYVELRRALGFVSETLNAEQIAAMEPALAGRFSHGLLLSDWRTVCDTETFLTELAHSFVEQGGKLVQDSVSRVETQGGRAVGVTLASGERLPVEQAVVAAGNGSSAFFEALGIKVPLIKVGGYQVLLPNPGVDLTHATFYADGGFGLIPMERGLQIGGTIEFAGNRAEPNFKRAEIILEKAKTILPSLNTAGMEFGAGWRPFLPDTKPVIDKSPLLENVAMAFGHGQLGLTLGATTGRLVADMLQGRDSQLDISPFSASRFTLAGG
ncbi:FAD-dependent oxidoreductase [Halomonas sp. IOP_6]|uniref:NAD(P)/FAD-dependent oxidoreductase n=1 Tax=Halomonas sp. IOP_6 TaxID=2876583 RepID=UPI001E6421DE|nr:FAD-dependent oxidoreductase [Halomonas sp. IOP_6]MCD6005786.1 FAD-dependent oxidoreductase [Halomonas sp. IOP_6]